MAVVNNSTLLIRVETGEYPIYLSMVRQNHPNLSLPQEPDESIINELGYAVVTPVDRPAGDVVTEGTPSLANGIYTQVWDVRNYNTDEVAVQLAQLKSERLAQINALREQQMAVGLEHLFPDATIGHVQLRQEDQINLHSLRIEAQAQLASGDTSPLFFRTYENETKQVSAQELLDLLNEALNYGKALYVASWNLKDQVTAATTIADVPAVPDKLV